MKKSARGCLNWITAIKNAAPCVFLVRGPIAIASLTLRLQGHHYGKHVTVSILYSLTIMLWWGFVLLVVLNYLEACYSDVSGVAEEGMPTGIRRYIQVAYALLVVIKNLVFIGLTGLHELIVILILAGFIILQSFMYYITVLISAHFDKNNGHCIPSSESCLHDQSRPTAKR